jgi:hypothetical protein
MSKKSFRRIQNTFAAGLLHLKLGLVMGHKELYHDIIILQQRSEIP